MSQPTNPVHDLEDTPQPCNRKKRRTSKRQCVCALRNARDARLESCMGSDDLVQFPRITAFADSTKRRRSEHDMRGAVTVCGIVVPYCCVVVYNNVKHAHLLMRSLTPTQRAPLHQHRSDPTTGLRRCGDCSRMPNTRTGQRDLLQQPIIENRFR